MTIVGNMQGISAEIEESLRRAGCTVMRISGKTGDDTLQLLNDLADQNGG